MPAGNQFGFIRIATTADGKELTFAANNVGDLLVAVFAAISTSNDFTTPPSTIQDTNGNTWNLQYFTGNTEETISTTYSAVAVYACNRCIETLTNILDMPAELVSPDSTTYWAYGVEFSSNFAEVDFAAVDAKNSQAANFALDLGDTLTNVNLLLGGAFDSGLEGTPIFTSRLTTIIPGTNVNSSVGYLFSGLSASLPTSTNVTVGTSTDVFGFLLMLVGSNATGGSSSQTLTFSINKGPLPIPPQEGRAIATVQIDCTQQLIRGLPINYPEYANFGDGLGQTFPNGFIVCEFDLEHLFQGAGLSEVRTLAYWARPGFSLQASGNREDAGLEPEEGGSAIMAALLTNKTTLQTIALGGSCEQQYGGSPNSTSAEFGIVPFPANKNSLKYRFIAPQGSIDFALGKYTLQFMNFEVMGSIVSTGAAGVGVQLSLT